MQLFRTSLRSLLQLQNRQYKLDLPLSAFNGKCDSHLTASRRTEKKMTKIFKAIAFFNLPVVNLVTWFSNGPLLPLLLC